MTQLLILGAGTAGTMAANLLRKALDDKRSGEDWQITVVDQDTDHHYQPGYLFVPFWMAPERVVRRTAGAPPIFFRNDGNSKSRFSRCP